MLQIVIALEIYSKYILKISIDGSEAPQKHFFTFYDYHQQIKAVPVTKRNTMKRGIVKSPLILLST